MVATALGTPLRGGPADCHPQRQALAHLEAYIDFSEDDNVEEEVLSRGEASVSPSGVAPWNWGGFSHPAAPAPRLSPWVGHGASPSGFFPPNLGVGMCCPPSQG